MLSIKVNEAKAGTVSDEMLRDRFVDGQHPSSLRHDIRRFVRERDGATFQQARAEELSWMREDNDVEVRTEQVQAAPSPTCQRRLPTWSRSAFCSGTYRLGKTASSPASRNTCENCINKSSK